MSLNNPYQQYHENSIFTARPEELTLMLYNGAIKFLKQAQISIETKEVTKVHNNIIRAQDIIMELRSTLDMKYEISNNLDALYEFMYNMLIQANIHKFDGGLKNINEVINFLEELRDTWKEAMKIAKISQQKSG